jgi:hypothetical protein
MSAASLWLPPQSSCCTLEKALRFFTVVRPTPKSSFESSSSVNWPFTCAWSTPDFM